MVATAVERPRRRRCGVHGRHRDVQRLGRPLPEDEAGSPDPGLVQPRVDGQRHAPGHRRQGGLAGPSGRRTVRRRRLLDADGRAAHGRRPRHPGQADDLQQLHPRHGPRRDDGGRLPTMGDRCEEPGLRGTRPPPPAYTASEWSTPPTSARPSSAPSPTPDPP